MHHETAVGILQMIVDNAAMIPDPRMEGSADCYAVPLDDIDNARAYKEDVAADSSLSFADLLKAKGLTQYAAAEYLGIGHSTVQHRCADPSKARRCELIALRVLPDMAEQRGQET